MSTILITGVAGFVGSNIARTALETGSHRVIGIDALTDYYSPSIKRGNLAALVASGLEFIEGDLNELDLAAVLGDVDVVFHEAGQPGVRASWGEEFARYTEDNILATQRLLEAAREASLSRFVYASSSSVYGDAERYPTEETDLPQPVSPYGVSKLAAEHLVTLYGRNFGLPTVSLRYFTVYGPGQRPDMAFTRFLSAAAQGEHITVFGTGEQVREFTYVGDIVAANLAAWSSDVAPGTVINLSGGSSVSVNEVLDVIQELADAPLKIERRDKVTGDVFRTGGSTRRARDLLGWQPSTELRAGLARQYEWVRTTLS